MNNVCDVVTGECECNEFFDGFNCDECFGGYWRNGTDAMCEFCDCDINGSDNDLCDLVRF